MTCVDAPSETGPVAVSFVGSDGQVEGELRHLWNARFEDVAPVRGFGSFKGQRHFSGSW